MAELPAFDSWTGSDDVGLHAFADLPVDATPDERALGFELAELDRLDRERDARDLLGLDGAAVYAGSVEDLAPWDVPVVTDEELLEGLAGRSVHEADLMLLASIDPGSLSAHGKVRYLQATDRVTARVVSLRHRTVVAMAGASSTLAHLSEVAVENEISFARRTSRYSAGRAIENARTLATAFPRFAAALHDGEVSEAHCAVLVEKTRVVADESILGELERRVLPKAKRLPPGRFAGEVATAIARLDRDAEARVKGARASRRVWVRQLEDGMGYLGLTHDWSTIHALYEAVAADGRCLQVIRGGSGAVADGVEDATADACRADALAARMLGSTGEDGSVSWERSEVAVTVNVVMDLDTLRGESDQIALLDGQPVPAGIGREIAAHATWWRRLVTDPVDGHLLDYGRATYLPDKLRRYVLARDDECRSPNCGTRAASRLQMDHATLFPDGPSDPGNTGALCTTCHQLKTAGHTTITGSHADGSCTWTTAWGQSIRVPPRSVLPIEPDPPAPPEKPAPPIPLDPPPF